MYQCGLPKEMALELFKPHIIRGLVERDIAHNIKSAKRLIESLDERVWDIVENVIKEYPVLLNRAPTLHRLGIQAFEPKLIGGRAIRLHPLVTAAFNADFDGDQMAVHVPLSEEAKSEARILMLGANNILNPKDGKPIVTPAQDIVLGNYYLTKEVSNPEKEGRIFKNPNEAMMAYERKEMDLHTRIVVPVSSFKYKVFTENQKDKYLVTTIGKLIFNEILPDAFPYVNEASTENIERITPNKFLLNYGVNIKEEIAKMPIIKPFNRNNLEKLIAQIFKRYKTTETSIMLDKLKNLGFKFSTLAGITISIADVISSKNKDKILEESYKMVETINKQFQRGLITEKERVDRVISVWTNARNEVQQELSEYIDSGSDNPFIMMMNSKARGNISQFTQVAGMRGLMQKPNGGLVEIPVISSFKEGLTVSEFFLSTHGARKGSADTALKTADSGYLTRRLVDVSQDIIVREEDCGTEQGAVVAEFIDEKSGAVIESFYDRIVGRYTNKKVIHPETKEIIIDKSELITENIAEKIINAGIKSLEIRSVLTCKTVNGVCRKCYGRNLATGNLVEIGEAVGIMAAQSIGEPGTQLTMRTFHTGGVAGEDITQGLPRVQELFEARNPKGKATICEISGQVSSIEEERGRYIIAITNEVETKEHITNYGSKLRVAKGDMVNAGDRLTEGAINPKELLAATDPTSVEEYILKEVQKVYRSQGVDISDKHIEIISRRMLSKIRIFDSGDTPLLNGSMVHLHEFRNVNKEAILQNKKPASGRPVLLGITKASLETDSFLSAASFQETTRILTDAAIKGKVDKLQGLKENVIIGKLIPAGTGVGYYSDVDYDLESQFVDDEPMEALEEEFME
jgi:DNA-directed RNA polymerase subunit beta'